MALFTPVGTNYIAVLDLATAASWYAKIFVLRQRLTQFDDGQKGIELTLSEEIYFVLGPSRRSHRPRDSYAVHLPD
jgi:hypothetical protein